MKINLEPTQRRKLQRLTDRIDGKILASDRHFFERFPHRSHRMRIASKLELAALRVVDPTGSGASAGQRAYVLVKQIAPGLRTRVFFVARANEDSDLSEEAARAVYESLTEHNPQFAAVDRAAGSMAAGKGGRA